MYAGLTLLFTWPMAARFETAVEGGGDAFHPLWSFWWFEKVIAHPLSIWDCPILLHPYGADPIQNDYFLWPNVLALVTRRLGLTLVGSYNASLWLAIWLNALSMFLLARGALKDRLAAFVGGLAFAFAPFFWGRIQGHLGFMHAYPLPLFALCLYKTQQTRSRPWAMGVGGSWVLAGWSQYSYAIYAGIYWILWSLYHRCPFSLKVEQRAGPRWRWSMPFFGMGAVAAAIAVAVSLGGGREVILGGVTIRARRSGKPLAIWCMGWLLAVLVRHRLTVARRSHPVEAPSGDLIRLWGYMVLPLILLVPLILRGARPILAGEYAAPYREFRGAFRRAYAVTALLPNIYPSVWGGCSSRSAGILEPLRPRLHRARLDSHRHRRREARRTDCRMVDRCLRGVLPSEPRTVPRNLSGARPRPRAPLLVHSLPPPRVCGSVSPALDRHGIGGVVRSCGRGISKDSVSQGAFAGVLFEGMAVPLPMTAADIPGAYRTPPLDRTTGAALELPFRVRDGHRFGGIRVPTQTTVSSDGPPEAADRRLRQRNPGRAVFDVRAPIDPAAVGGMADGSGPHAKYPQR